MTKNSEQEALLQRAGRILALREHGRAELRTKLLRPGRDGAKPGETQVESALDRLEELGLLDDGRYARLAAEQLARKGLSAGGIRRELLARGVDAQAISEAQPPAEDDAERLAALLRQPRYARKLADERGLRSAFQAMLRRGYREDDIRRALRDAAENCADIADEVGR